MSDYSNISIFNVAKNRIICLLFTYRGNESYIHILYLWFNRYSIKQRLSDREYEVYSLMVNGLKYDEIATLLNRDLKQVDNTIQRVKNKIKKILVDR